MRLLRISKGIYTVVQIHSERLPVMILFRCNVVQDRRGVRVGKSGVFMINVAWGDLFIIGVLVVIVGNVRVDNICLWFSSKVTPCRFVQVVLARDTYESTEWRWPNNAVVPRYEERLLVVILAL